VGTNSIKIKVLLKISKVRSTLIKDNLDIILNMLYFFT
jgi:hypothetical protein